LKSNFGSTSDDALSHDKIYRNLVKYDQQGCMEDVSEHTLFVLKTKHIFEILQLSKDRDFTNAKGKIITS
jgi:hypothetical protein